MNLKFFFLSVLQISCSANDKLVHILALLKLELVQKKVLIFVNSIDMGFRLRLFLEQVRSNACFLLSFLLCFLILGFYSFVFIFYPKADVSYAYTK